MKQQQKTEILLALQLGKINTETLLATFNTRDAKKEIQIEIDSIKSAIEMVKTIQAA